MLFAGTPHCTYRSVRNAGDQTESCSVPRVLRNRGAEVRLAGDSLTCTGGETGHDVSCPFRDGVPVVVTGRLLRSGPHWFVDETEVCWGG